MLGLFKKNSRASGGISISTLLSNYEISKWLDELPWNYDTFYKYESVTFKQINEISLFVGSILSNVNKAKIEGKNYFKNFNQFCRTWPEMKHPEEKKQFNFTYREIKP